MLELLHPVRRFKDWSVTSGNGVLGHSVVSQRGGKYAPPTMFKGSSVIGLATARRARDEGSDVILTARDPIRLQRVGPRARGGVKKW